MDSFTPYADLFANPQGPGDARPTALQVVRDLNLVGKLAGRVILITGGTSGLGLETARAIHTTGADVYITARSSAKAQSAVDSIKSSSAGSGKLEVIDMDMNSLESVKKAAKAFLEQSSVLNVLINNAGIMATPGDTKTSEGFDQQFGVNHLAHFALTSLLLPTLVASSTPSLNSRVVVVTSSAHRMAPVNLADPNFSSSDYNPWAAYAQSKTANLWMANYIDRTYGPRGVRSVSVQPGVTPTAIHQHVDPVTANAWKSDPAVAAGARNADQGAATSVWAATAAVWEGEGGKYLFDMSVGGPAKEMESLADYGYAPHAFDEESEDKLWKLSEELTGVKVDL
ncbi:Dehydrogenase/reductase SDR family member on chromosome X [Colletotrichum spinosum]|uniref:Dehydrogenase/reductase SDR family member on chromosome X n=1 Tax=Colletotrichum spinosum TaxID=1347390 RepID=A0A4R8QEW8_9PEZI|nr:Dehydrogenase/reductase SDR family member on chromosome X [Colletotrichum spinosum]